MNVGNSTALWSIALTKIEEKFKNTMGRIEISAVRFHLCIGLLHLRGKLPQQTDKCCGGDGQSPITAVG